MRWSRPRKTCYVPPVPHAANVSHCANETLTSDLFNSTKNHLSSDFPALHVHVVIYLLFRYLAP
jgi:hypothetical protein